MYFQNDISDIQIRKPNSPIINTILEREKDNITGEAMLSFWLESANQTRDIKLTMISWYKKRYKTFLLHYGSSINEIIVDDNKVDYFLDMGLGGSGFTYQQIIEDFFAHIEEKHGNLINCEVFFL